MEKFRINKEYDIVCEVKPTRMAFKHEATLLKNGREIEKVKICYQNRTWERYQFESVMSKLLDKAGDHFTKGQKTRFLNKRGY